MQLTRIALLFCILYSSQLQAQNWVKHQISGYTNLAQVVFQDKDTGYILTSQVIKRTTDAGKTWTQILSGYNKFSCITFADRLNGCVVGYNDLVLVTADGGRNWTLRRTGNSDDDFITVHMNGDTIYVLGPDDLDTYKYANYLNYTFNRGTSWNRYSTGSTNTIRTMKQINKNFGMMGTLTAGVFRTTNGWGSYTQVWPSPSIQIRDMAVIKDSVVILVGNSGKISRSNDYGASFSGITSPVSSHLSRVSFANDTLGMITGDAATILITRDAGLSWTKMTAPTAIDLTGLHLINPLYGWATGLRGSDSFDIFKYGSEEYITEKLNFISGQLSADLDHNCKKDSVAKGPDGVLLTVTPGPFYTYTEKNGTYQVIIPDTGTYTITASLPEKYRYGNGLCDTTLSPVNFSKFETFVYNKDFLFDTDTTVNLEVKLASSRKRRCFVNENILTYKNIGFTKADSIEIKFFYPSELISIKNASQNYSGGNGTITFKAGSLKPGESGKIVINDSVLCNSGVMNRSVCMQALITPFQMVKNTSWDSSWIVTRINCKTDSTVVIKVFNTGDEMKDTAELDVFLDDDPAGIIKYKLGEADSLRLELDRKHKTVIVTGDISKNHPYQQRLVVFKETCTNDTMLGGVNQVTKFSLQKYPSFETQLCLPIRDSYDPNDITVTPGGRKEEHWIDKDITLNYHIRFQNTGNDTAYNIHILDTLPFQVNKASIDVLGSSHNFTYALIPASDTAVLRFDFKNIMLVDSATNEPGSNGWINFNINLNKGLKHRTRIQNFVDIYFDFNDPVRTNTAFVTIYDTVLSGGSNNALKPCAASIEKLANETVVCDQLQAEVKVLYSGVHKPVLFTADTSIWVQKVNDTTFRVTSKSMGIYTLMASIEDCDQLVFDTAMIVFSQTPKVQLTDSVHCDKVNQLLTAACSDCSFIWSDNSTAGNLQINMPGTYSVRANNKCGISKDTAEIEVMPVYKRLFGNDTTICATSNYELKAISGNKGLVWWDNSADTSKKIVQPGLYYATFTNRCNLLTDSIKISFGGYPVVNLGADTGFCEGSSIRYDLNPGNDDIIRWNDGKSDTVRLIAAGGLYWVTLTNACGSTTDTVEIELYEQPKADFSWNFLCKISDVDFFNKSVLTKNNFSSINWDFNGEGTAEGSTVNFGFNKAGNKQITLGVVTDKGCKHDTTKTIMADDKIMAAGYARDTCQGKALQFVNNSNSDVPFTAKWQFGDGFTSTDINPSHVYPYQPGQSKTYLAKLLIINENDCRDSVVIPATIIGVALPKISFTGYTSQFPGSFVMEIENYVPGFTYYWTADGRSFATGNRLLLNKNQLDSIANKEICAVARDPNPGCFSNMYCWFFKVSMGIWSHSNQILGMYPNPVNQNLTFKPGVNVPLQITISNTAGNIVDQFEISGEVVKDMAMLQAGVYFVQVKDAQGNVSNLRFIKN